MIIATEPLVSTKERWKVLEDLMVSDHQYISFEMTNGFFQYSDPRQIFTWWNARKINVVKFVEVF